MNDTFTVNESNRHEYDPRNQKKAIGIDCNGLYVFINDQIEVAVDLEDLKADPRYDFCSKGKKGVVTQNYHNDFNNWLVIVHFPDSGYSRHMQDFRLKKIVA
ncbi:hypothetical protein HOE31_03255 [bacterium]|jgi:hypothetical protein|nr:hypothetical protein [bacterium]MBT4121937.1 hypothetical protein [bacterium]MBT4334900.1 hypothetical protein [bacterium]MBT4495839.1 hypothetical protein [bacterium]MBT4763716.1 hypothetical protein [bacterium]